MLNPLTIDSAAFMDYTILARIVWLIPPLFAQR